METTVGQWTLSALGQIPDFGGTCEPWKERRTIRKESPVPSAVEERQFLQQIQQVITAQTAWWHQDRLDILLEQRWKQKCQLDKTQSSQTLIPEQTKVLLLACQNFMFLKQIVKGNHTVHLSW
jgi:hypothetical protein